MEEILTKLLDYQKFEKNPRLEKLIKESGELRELSDDELGLVSAAGAAESLLKKKSEFER